MRVIGTAGHIDHGKSSLVHALTGIDPDRLPEEKARGMTIELGFAWIDLGSQRDGRAGNDIVGVVDVPGHERFVRHMLAGVGGIDLALLVVAADEAVMPQTREHLAILDLLQVRHAVVALTKADLVEDDWLALARAEVRQALAGTTLAASPIVPCSSRTGDGLERLRATLAQELANTPERLDRGRPHLPVDRVFTLTGFGTVVTGTLLDGSLAVGQEIAFAPDGIRARIRGLQSHGRPLDRIGPGRRVAVNVSGVAVDDLARGMVLSLPGAIPAAHYLDLRLRVVRGAGVEVTHGMPVIVHTGAAEAPGRLRLLEVDRLRAGEEGWAQVALETPIAALRGDRAIVRVPSPAATVAGGGIVAINPPRHRRRHQPTLERLAVLAAATPEERLLDVLAAGPRTEAELGRRADLPLEQVAAGLATLERNGQVRKAGKAGKAAYWVTPSWLDAALVRAREALAAFHRQYPLRRGMQGGALREILAIESRVWSELLESWRQDGSLGGLDELVWLQGHLAVPTAAQERAATAWLERLSTSLFAPPSGAEPSELDAEMLAMLLERGNPVRIAEGVYLRRAAYEEMRAGALEIIDEQGQVTVGALRDRFGTSRKFALGLLEQLDDLRVTRRLGEGRVRGPAAIRS